MKKILLFSTLVLMFSCSDESNINGIEDTSENSNLGAKSFSFDDLFDGYIYKLTYLSRIKQSKLIKKERI